MHFTEAQFMELYKTQLHIHNKSFGNTTLERRIRAAYGFSPYTIQRIWSYLLRYGEIPHGGHPKHMLWMLSFLKSYNTYDVYATWYGCTQLTFRKWVWKFLHAIASITSIVSRNTSMKKYIYLSN
jgi:hypothetical protein